MTKSPLLLSLFALFAFSAASLPAAHAADAKPAVLKLGSKGDTMTFDKDKLSVKAGQPVKLTFTNNAKPTAGLQHNWVLTQPGKADGVATAGISAGADKGWIPTSEDIIAHTKLLNSGESETIEFTAPAKAGAYPFLCTFPGHSSMMKGTLTVK
jgi:azurin